MPKYRYFVAKGRSILMPPKSSNPNMILGRLTEGQEIPDGLLSTPELMRKIRDGFVIAEGMAPREEAPLGGTVPHEVDASKAAVTEDARLTPTIQTAVIPNPQNPEITTKPSPFDLDPESLEGKDLDELRVMILERDEEFDTDSVDTIEEAIDYLSQDHEWLKEDTE